MLAQLHASRVSLVEGSYAALGHAGKSARGAVEARKKKRIPLRMRLSSEGTVLMMMFNRNWKDIWEIGLQADVRPWDLQPYRPHPRRMNKRRRRQE